MVVRVGVYKKGRQSGAKALASSGGGQRQGNRGKERGEETGPWGRRFEGRIPSEKTGMSRKEIEGKKGTAKGSAQAEKGVGQAELKYRSWLLNWRVRATRRVAREGSQSRKRVGKNSPQVWKTSEERRKTEAKLGTEPRFSVPDDLHREGGWK